jgi:hypothetical protein
MSRVDQLNHSTDSHVLESGQSLLVVAKNPGKVEDVKARSFSHIKTQSSVHRFFKDGGIVKCEGARRSADGTIYSLSVKEGVRMTRHIANCRRCLQSLGIFEH